MIQGIDLRNWGPCEIPYPGQPELKLKRVGLWKNVTFVSSRVRVSHGRKKSVLRVMYAGITTALNACFPFPFSSLTEAQQVPMKHVTRFFHQLAHS